MMEMFGKMPGAHEKQSQTIYLHEICSAKSLFYFKRSKLIMLQHYTSNTLDYDRVGTPAIFPTTKTQHSHVITNNTNLDL